MIIEIKHTQGIEDTTKVVIINKLTKKTIREQNIFTESLQTFIVSTTIRQTAEIIREMVKSRYQNYKHSDYFKTDPQGWASKMRVFDRLMQQSETLFLFKSIEGQTRFIQDKMLPFLRIINPNNERFHTFPKLIAAFEKEVPLNQISMILE